MRFCLRETFCFANNKCVVPSLVLYARNVGRFALISPQPTRKTFNYTFVGAYFPKTEYPLFSADKDERNVREIRFDRRTTQHYSRKGTNNRVIVYIVLTNRPHRRENSLIGQRPRVNKLLNLS